MILPIGIMSKFTSDEDRLEFMNAYNNAAWIREILTDYLYEQLVSLYEEGDKVEQYNVANLEELRADQRGQRRKLREMIQLLTGENHGGTIRRAIQRTREEEEERRSRRRQARRRPTGESEELG